jgi:hypothetical protein
MPKGTKAAKAERAIMKSARAKGLKGDALGRYVYGALNNIGLKRGSKTTAHGKSRAHKR